MAHREQITKSDPPLPASASHDFERMYQAFRIAFEVARGDEKRFRRAIFEQVPASAKSSSKIRNRSGSRTVSVVAIARPEPSVPTLGRAIMMMAEELDRTERRDAEQKSKA